MRQEVDLLHTAGDYIDHEGVRRHEGEKPRIRRIPYNISYLFNRESVVYWLLDDSHVSDDAILRVTELLPLELESNSTIQAAFLYSGEIIPESTFDIFVKVLCKNIKKDLKQNQGIAFRRLIEVSAPYALSEILGNEDLRDKLFQCCDFTVYDLEEAVVKVTILSLARTHVDLLERIEEGKELLSSVRQS